MRFLGYRGADGAFGRVATLAAALAIGLPAAALAPATASAQTARVPATISWFSPASGHAAQQLVQLIATASADGLKPKRYNVKGLERAVRDASRNPGAIRRADAMLTQAFVAYARDLQHDPRVGVIYVDPELRPTPMSASALLGAAAAAPSLEAYIAKMGWMNPVYAPLRQAIATRMYRSGRERQLLAINLERARAMPGGYRRFVIVNPVAQRLYMYENGQVVDQMRVVAGKPGPITETPMMNAFFRFAILNPYWNSPADITARKLAPKVVKQGRAYLNRQGYEVLSNWGDHAKVIDPMTIDWKAVVAGQIHVRMRQKTGPSNSMGKMKFMFPNKQGIWLHDTPEKDVLDEADRLDSNGCVRLADAQRLARWLFGRTLKTKGTRPEQKVALNDKVPVYITYLTAVPSGSSIVFFDDVYGRDSRRMADAGSAATMAGSN
jgi:murein L,D-transpeptidase YcbB/YkuD